MAFDLINPLYPRPHTTAGGSGIASGYMLSVAFSTNSGTSFTTANLTSDCLLCFLDIQGSNVICTFDGTYPSNGTAGHILAAGTNYTWQRSTVLNAKFNSVSSASTTSYIYLSQFAL